MPEQPTITCGVCRTTMDPQLRLHWCIPTEACIRAGERNSTVLICPEHIGSNTYCLDRDAVEVLYAMPGGKARVRCIVGGDERTVSLHQLRWLVLSDATDAIASIT